MTFNKDGLKKLALGENWLRRNPLFYPNAYRQFDLLERLDLQLRREAVNERLNKVLRAAKATAYGRNIRATQIYENWPLLTKESVRDRPEAFLGPRPWLAARASTGGTTGVPLKLWRSAESVAVEQACLDRLFERLGADARVAKVAVLRGDNIDTHADPQAPYWRYALGDRRLLLSSNHLSAQTLPQYADILDSFRPDVLFAYPTSLEYLCHLLEKAGRSLQIPKALTSSEVLKPQSWQLARRVLGCQLIDYYGQAERVGFAAAREPEQYRFLPGYAFIEFIPVESEGAGMYEIVGTSLWNLTMPLVRYRTGDLVCLPASWTARELEEVSLGVRPFSGILGRDQEILFGPQGQRLTGINQVPRGIEHVLRMQVIQERADRVRVLVLADRGYSDADGAKIMHNMRLKVPPSMQVHIETAEQLERTAAGKMPFVILRPAVRSEFGCSS